MIILFPSNSKLISFNLTPGNKVNQLRYFFFFFSEVFHTQISTIGMKKKEKLSGRMGEDVCDSLCV